MKKDFSLFGDMFDLDDRGIATLEEELIGIAIMNEAWEDEEESPEE